MPTSPFHLLPLCKGWEYKIHSGERTVTRGADPIAILEKDETGWLIQVSLLTYDCYGSLLIDYQGAELETRRTAFNPEGYRSGGLDEESPAGYNARYFRPNPNSTAGIYYMVGWLATHGLLLPYIPTIKASLFLTEDSTQNSAYINASATVIAITDLKAFIQSLRRILDAKADLWIDPALFVSGPAALEEKPK